MTLLPETVTHVCGRLNEALSTASYVTAEGYVMSSISDNWNSVKSILTLELSHGFATMGAKESNDGALTLETLDINDIFKEVDGSVTSEENKTDNEKMKEKLSKLLISAAKNGHLDIVRILMGLEEKYKPNQEAMYDAGKALFAYGVKISNIEYHIEQQMHKNPKIISPSSRAVGVNPPEAIIKVNEIKRELFEIDTLLYVPLLKRDQIYADRILARAVVWATNEKISDTPEGMKSKQQMIDLRQMMRSDKTKPPQKALIQALIHSAPNENKWVKGDNYNNKRLYFGTKLAELMDKDSVTEALKSAVREGKTSVVANLVTLKGSNKPTETDLREALGLLKENKTNGGEEQSAIVGILDSALQRSTISPSDTAKNPPTTTNSNEHQQAAITIIQTDLDSYRKHLQEKYHDPLTGQVSNEEMKPIIAPIIDNVALMVEYTKDNDYVNLARIVNDESTRYVGKNSYYTTEEDKTYASFLNSLLINIKAILIIQTDLDSYRKHLQEKHHDPLTGQVSNEEMKPIIDNVALMVEYTKDNDYVNLARIVNDESTRTGGKNSYYTTEEDKTYASFLNSLLIKIKAIFAPAKIKAPDYISDRYKNAMIEVRKQTAPLLNNTELKNERNDNNSHSEGDPIDETAQP